VYGISRDCLVRVVISRKFKICRNILGRDKACFYGDNCTAKMERCFLCGPCRDVVSRTVSESPLYNCRGNMLVCEAVT
jgi:hypothetical protein